MGTASIWAARVAAWRASGQSARQFCEGKDFSAAALRTWGSKLGRVAPPAREVRIAKVVPAGALVDETPIVLEAGGVRVAVRRGFDAEALGAVLDVLRSRA